MIAPEKIWAWEKQTKVRDGASVTVGTDRIWACEILPAVADTIGASEYTRTDLSQAAVGVALEAAAKIAYKAWDGEPEDGEAIRSEIRALISPAQHDALAAHVAAEVAKARAEDAAVLAESRAYGLAMQEELRVRTAKLERECKLTQAQVDRMLVNSTQMDANITTLAEDAARVLHDIDDLVANSEGVTGLHMNGEVAEWSAIMDGGSFGAWLCSVETLRNTLAQIGAKP